MANARDRKSPIAEGREFQAMFDSGLSVEEIAERESCPVAQVQHRLKLLELMPLFVPGESGHQ